MSNYDILKIWVIAAIVLCVSLLVSLILVLHRDKPAKPARVNITHTEVYHVTDAKGQKCVLTVNPVPEPDTWTCTSA